MLLTTLASGSAKGFGFSLGGLPDQLFYLVVAGGGSGGGGNGAGGGGAGGFRTNLPTQTSGGTPGNPESIIPAVSGTFTITVGAAGNASKIESANPLFTDILSVAGGGGGAGAGGSGGGRSAPQGVGAGGAATANQGFDGGAVADPGRGGGGGGASAVGAPGAPAGNGPGRAGGPGRTSDITGTTLGYAGGGASGMSGTSNNDPSGVPHKKEDASAPLNNVDSAAPSQNPASYGQFGGGGGGYPNGPNVTPGGGAPALPGQPGGTNTGGGGGGGGGHPQAGGAGTGGSGVVIVAHPSQFGQRPTTGSASISTVSGNIVYKFTGDGTISF